MDLLDLAKGVQHIKAYQGGPHRVGEEGYQNDKIGTGEGAAAYGHGHYFAEHEPVAKGYRDALNEKYRSVLSYAGPDRARNAASILAGNHPDETVIEALKSLDDPNPHKSLEEGRKIYEDAKNSGYMHEVAIHAHPDHMLNWDEPLHQQSKHVRDAFDFHKDLIHSNPYLETFFNNMSEGHSTGSQIYKELSDKNAVGLGDKGASDFLHSMGIRGIRYLDERSRGDKPWVLKHPQGGVNEFPNESSAREFHARNPEYSIESPKLTHNYVVFDPKDIEITRRYEKGGVVRRAYMKGGKVEGSIWHGKDADVEYGEPTNSAIVQHVLAKIAAPLPASIAPLGNVTGRRQ